MAQSKSKKPSPVKPSRSSGKSVKSTTKSSAVRNSRTVARVLKPASKKSAPAKNVVTRSKPVVKTKANVKPRTDGKPVVRRTPPVRKPVSAPKAAPIVKPSAAKRVPVESNKIEVKATKSSVSPAAKAPVNGKPSVIGKAPVTEKVPVTGKAPLIGKTPVVGKAPSAANAPVAGKVLAGKVASGKGTKGKPVVPVVVPPVVKFPKLPANHVHVGSMPVAREPGMRGSGHPAPARLVKGRPVDTSPVQPPRPVPVPVTTDGKPKKNQAGLGLRELEHFRDLLLVKRRELVGDMSSMEHEALRSTSGSNLSNLPVHMADMGTDNYEQEFTLGLMEKDRQLLREINTALAKIQDGSYGVCEGTNLSISKPRLEAQPWAKYSIEYARQMEKRRF